MRWKVRGVNAEYAPLATSPCFNFVIYIGVRRLSCVAFGGCSIWNIVIGCHQRGTDFLLDWIYKVKKDPNVNFYFVKCQSDRCLRAIPFRFI